MKIPVMEVHMYIVYLISLFCLVYVNFGEGYSVLNDLYMADTVAVLGCSESHANHFIALPLTAS